MVKKHDRWQEQVLIQWHGVPAEAATWEPYEEIQQQFPTFNLEDKVFFKGGGNDTKKGKTVALEGSSHRPIGRMKRVLHHN
ncbi:Chromo domain-containing protein [Arachis hypogaea]|nr:Chromo domain-containing protein [Arachis hypogaea]